MNINESVYKYLDSRDLLNLYKGHRRELDAMLEVLENKLENNIIHEPELLSSEVDLGDLSEEYKIKIVKDTMSTYIKFNVFNRNIHLRRKIENFIDIPRRWKRKY